MVMMIKKTKPTLNTFAQKAPFLIFSDNAIILIFRCYDDDRDRVWS